METWWWGRQIQWSTDRSFGDYATFLVFLALITFAFSEKPLVLRRTLLMLAPLVALFFIGGYPGEFRAFYEVVPACVSWPSGTST
jgi:hypothetical protein